MKIFFLYIKCTQGQSRAFIYILVWFMLIMPFSLPGVYAETPAVYDPYEVKAALLIKFIDFVQWPDESFSQEPDSFVLGILGYDVFKGVFTPFINKKIDSKIFKIKNFCNVNEISQVQILFISESEMECLPEILDHLKQRHILTVADTKGAAQDGVIINFIEKKPTSYICYFIHF